MSGETTAHKELKRASLHWAQAHRYPICGLEISLPNSSYRADAAAFRPARTDNEQELTVVFECKQSRPDFLKDSKDTDTLKARLQNLHQRRRRLTRLLAVHHPSLRRGDSLFPEYESYDLESLPHRGFRRTINEIQQIDRALCSRTKFDRLIRYRCANLFYLVARESILDPDEVPLAWGLLLQKDEGDLVLARTPTFITTEASTRRQLLHRIAASNTRRLSKAEGLPDPFESRRPVNPGCDDTDRLCNPSSSGKPREQNHATPSTSEGSPPHTQSDSGGSDQKISQIASHVRCEG